MWLKKKLEEVRSNLTKKKKNPFGYWHGKLQFVV
jgi:hypothetical protein